MDALHLDTVIAALTGPFGALIVTVGILYWVANKALPMLQSYFDGHNDRLKEMVEALNKTVDAHEKDRATFEEAINKLSVRLENVEEDIEDIKGVINVKEKTVSRKS